MISLHDYDAYCFDLDGTIYLGNDMLPGVKETLTQIRNHQKKILFITNSPTLTRLDGKKRLEKLGVPSELDEVITTPYLSALYFADEYPDACVFIIGEKAIEEELHSYSIKTTNYPFDASHVLVGLDRSFTYQKLQMAMSAVRNGAKLIVTNPDPVCPVQGGYIPDTMSLAKAIEVASGQNIFAIIGKPNVIYGNKMVEKLGTATNKTLVIGDRLETDIRLGITKGFGTCLVLTGVSRRKDLAASTFKPDYVIENLKGLFL